MRPDDCERVASIRVGGWRHAYRGLMPAPYLEGLSVAEDTARRRASLAEAPSTTVNLVAEDAAGLVVGWACHGDLRDDGAHEGDAELYALYVDTDRLGTGVGRCLLGESTRRCAAAGYRSAFLWVVEGNARARRFYERAGFRADGTTASWEVAGAHVPEARYVRTLGD
ncbi:GNAT family N-acetyltransferase [Streptomyces sp. ZYX-F-203]